MADLSPLTTSKAKGRGRTDLLGGESPRDNETTGPMKKFKKVSDYQPPVENGVISASNTPTIDDGRVVDISPEKSSEINEESLSDFFGPEVTKRDDFPNYPISDWVMEVLKSATAAEEELRDAVFTDFVDKHGIPFLPSSCSKDTRKNGAKKYSEQNLINLLEAFGQEIGEKKEKMRRIMRGLPVTTTSLPDLVPIDHRNPREGYQLCMGEFKNADKYFEGKASSQCLMYLLGLLYWLRTVLGKPVEAVYGFYVCGRRCSDQSGTDYTVGLLKLTAPQYLGDAMKAVNFSVTEEVESPFPLQLLIHFLKQGKRWSISNCPVAKDPTPCLFVLPTNLWSDDSDRTLVIHGTQSMVFFITATGICQLVRNTESPHFKDQRHGRPWLEYWDGILTKIQNTTTRYYLKVRSKVSVWKRMPMGPMNDVWNILISLEDLEITKTYLDRPFVSEDFGVILMNDRGINLRDCAIDFGEAMFPQFSKIMARAMLLCEHLPHGDALPHNIVCDQAMELTLIDIDEGVAKPSTTRKRDDVILKRKNEYGEYGLNWFIALRYPNPLRTKSKLYTQTQLIATFLSLMAQVGNPSQQTVNAFNELHDGARELGVFLYNIDKKPKEAKIKLRDMESMTELVTASYSKLEKIVQG